MGIIENFMTYAGEFEETFKDDNWERLRRFFTDDAVYSVRNISFACELRGPDAILAGLKKSLDGFDRRFESRSIEIVGEPELTDDSISISWRVTYTLGDAPPYLLEGRSSARYADDLLVELIDSYPEGTDERAAEWIDENGIGFDPSYV